MYKYYKFIFDNQYRNSPPQLIYYSKSLSWDDKSLPLYPNLPQSQLQTLHISASSAIDPDFKLFSSFRIIFTPSTTYYYES